MTQADLILTTAAERHEARVIEFGSVCSGIEASSVAFEPLGWGAAWFAEIEAFPSAVLAHRFPHVRNLGDMTLIAREVLEGAAPAPDVLCGGTPCQAFSVAGLRESLSDARGGLTLKFVELANAIDHVRTRRGEGECVVLWENVPGVLSTKDNAFGCFLGALVGESEPIKPAGGKWTDAGCVYGPQRTVAWRVLDAQYFGLAQRRRRVFVVASAREGFDPGAVLFEFDGVRRDTAPSREAWQVAPTIPSRSTGGGGLGTDFDCDGGLIQQAFGGNKTSGPRDIASALSAHGGTGRHDFDTETFIAHTLRGEGFDASEDGTGRGTPLVPVSYAIQAGALRTNPDSGPDGVGVQADHAYTLEARAEVQCVAFDTTQITSAENRSNPQSGDPCHPLAAGAHPPAIAFDCKASGMAGFGVGEVASTMRAMGHKGSHGNGGGQLAVAIGLPDGNASEAGPIEALCALREAIGAEAFGWWCTGVAVSLQPKEILRQDLHGGGVRCEANETGCGLDDGALPRPQGCPAGAMREVWEAGCNRRAPQGRGLPQQHAGELDQALSQLPPEGAQPTWLVQCLRSVGEGAGVLQQALHPVQRGAPQLQVRRLTPREAERLQGFPDDWTLIPWRTWQESTRKGISYEGLLAERGMTLRGPSIEETPDGPRYKALGNSWPVPVVSWIGRRIDVQLRRLA